MRHLIAPPDCKHVVFGEVVEGLEVLPKMNEAAGVKGPKGDDVIADCGTL